MKLLDQLNCTADEVSHFVNRFFRSKIVKAPSRPAAAAVPKTSVAQAVVTKDPLPDGVPHAEESQIDLDSSFVNAPAPEPSQLAAEASPAPQVVQQPPPPASQQVERDDVAAESDYDDEQDELDDQEELNELTGHDEQAEQSNPTYANNGSDSTQNALAIDEDADLDDEQSEQSDAIYSTQDSRANDADGHIYAGETDDSDENVSAEKDAEEKDRHLYFGETDETENDNYANVGSNDQGNGVPRQNESPARKQDVPQQKEPNVNAGLAKAFSGLVSQVEPVVHQLHEAIQNKRTQHFRDRLAQATNLVQHANGQQDWTREQVDMAYNEAIHELTELKREVGDPSLQLKLNVDGLKMRRASFEKTLGSEEANLLEASRRQHFSAQYEKEIPLVTELPQAAESGIPLLQKAEKDLDRLQNTLNAAIAEAMNYRRQLIVEFERVVPLVDRAIGMKGPNQAELGHKRDEVKQFFAGGKNKWSAKDAHDAIAKISTMAKDEMFNYYNEFEALQQQADRIPVDPNELQAGQELKSGSFGTTFMLDGPGGQKLVGKTAKDDSTANDLKNEVGMYAAVGQHPNIAQCYGFHDIQTENGKESMLVMECITGGNLGGNFEQLAELQKSSAIGREEYLGAVQQMMKGTLQGLAHLESVGITHKDIKNDNVMFDPVTNEAKIIDFGLAQKSGTQKSMKWAPVFSPPEAQVDAKAEIATPAWDAFGVGHMLHLEMERSPDLRRAYPLPGTSPHLADKSAGTTFGEDLPRQADVRKAQTDVLTKDKDGNFVARVGDKNRPLGQALTQGKDAAAASQPGHYGAETEYVDFLNRLMHPDPKQRMTASEALKHPFMTDSLADEKTVKDAFNVKARVKTDYQKLLGEAGDLFSKCEKLSDTLEQLRSLAASRLGMLKNDNIDSHSVENIVSSIDEFLGSWTVASQSMRQLDQWMSANKAKIPSPEEAQHTVDKSGGQKITYRGIGADSLQHVEALQSIFNKLAALPRQDADLESKADQLAGLVRQLGSVKLDPSSSVGDFLQATSKDAEVLLQKSDETVVETEKRLQMLTEAPAAQNAELLEKKYEESYELQRNIFERKSEVTGTIANLKVAIALGSAGEKATDRLEQITKQLQAFVDKWPKLFDSIVSARTQVTDAAFQEFVKPLGKYELIYLSQRYGKSNVTELLTSDKNEVLKTGIAPKRDVLEFLFGALQDELPDECDPSILTDDELEQCLDANAIPMDIEYKLWGGESAFDEMWKQLSSEDREKADELFEGGGSADFTTDDKLNMLRQFKAATATLQVDEEPPSAEQLSDEVEPENQMEFEEQEEFEDQEEPDFDDQEPEGEDQDAESPQSSVDEKFHELFDRQDSAVQQEYFQEYGRSAPREFSTAEKEQILHELTYN